MVGYLWLAIATIIFQGICLFVENPEIKKVFYRTIIFGALLTVVAGVLTGNLLSLLWLIIAFTYYKSLKTIES